MYFSELRDPSNSAVHHSVASECQKFHVEVKDHGYVSDAVQKYFSDDFYLRTAIGSIRVMIRTNAQRYSGLFTMDKAPIVSVEEKIGLYYKTILPDGSSPSIVDPSIVVDRLADRLYQLQQNAKMRDAGKSKRE